MEHNLFLAKVLVQKHSVIYFVMLIVCCGSMSCVMYESYAVQLSPAADVLVLFFFHLFHLR